MDAYRNYTREHRLFMENADLQERVDFAERYAKELEELVEQMHGALDEIWPDYMATYPSSAELLERYPVLKEHTV